MTGTRRMSQPDPVADPVAGPLRDGSVTGPVDRPAVRPDDPPDDLPDDLGAATRRAEARARMQAATPEPSLGSRLGQIGILGWAIVTPMLLGVWLGGRLDRAFDSGILCSGAGIFLGTAVGCHAAWHWMHRP